MQAAVLVVCIQSYSRCLLETQVWHHAVADLVVCTAFEPVYLQIGSTRGSTASQVTPSQGSVCIFWTRQATGLRKAGRVYRCMELQVLSTRNCSKRIFFGSMLHVLRILQQNPLAG